MAYDPDNVFAKILRGEIPCDRVAENDFALAFKDISPQAPVHVLVIPKGQYVSTDDFYTRAAPEEVAGLGALIVEAARVSGVSDEGYRLIANQGRNGGQEVDHFHVHILGGRPIGRMVVRT